LRSVGDLGGLRLRLQVLGFFQMLFADLVDRRIVLDFADIDVLFDDLQRLLPHVLFGVRVALAPPVGEMNSVEPLIWVP